MQSIEERTLAHLSSAEIRTALATALAFLRRFRDAFTVSHVEELSQDAVVIGLSRWDALHDKRRFGSYVRTIARRQRAHAIRDEVRGARFRLDGEWRLSDAAAAEQDEEHVRIADELVPLGVLFQALPQALAELEGLNAQLLMSYYEGFSYVELAVRFELPLSTVKARVHRARRRVKQLLVRHTLGDGEVPSPHNQDEKEKE